MKMRTVLGAAGLAMIALIAAGGERAAAAETKPNIVLIFADDI
jgi:hypothetical protein